MRNKQPREDLGSKMMQCDMETDFVATSGTSKLMEIPEQHTLELTYHNDPVDQLERAKEEALQDLNQVKREFAEYSK